MAEASLPHQRSIVQIPSAECYSRSGVYFLHLKGEIVYVGQAIDMRKRIANHMVEGVKNFDAVSCTPCGERNLLGLERYYITRLVPRYNSCHLSKQLRDMMRKGWSPEAQPLPLEKPVAMNDAEAAAFLGLSEEQFQRCRHQFNSRRRRRPRSTSVYRLYDLAELIAYAEGRLIPRERKPRWTSEQRAQAVLAEAA